MRQLFLPPDKAKMDPFEDLDDPMVLYILSFLAELPYETSSKSVETSLTHTLPSVNKRFYRLCSTFDHLWKMCFMRLLKKEDELWGPLLRKVNPTTKRRNDYLSQSKPFYRTITYRKLYKETLRNHVRGRLPLLDSWFHEKSQLQLGKEFELYLIQPEHQFLISQIMITFSSNRDFMNGVPITPFETNSGNSTLSSDGYPTFIYLCTNRRRDPFGSKGEIAFKVEIRRCLIFPGHRTAFVILRPVAYVRIERVWEYKYHERMYGARFLNIGKEESKKLENSCIEKNWIQSVLDQFVSSLLSTTRR